ncbi:hypothetical protein DOTSEDRAFT_72308 [Dothistroma septosporum NZE10]|uniref:MutL C-terminal dimerisation domain-containing protein n=1 Tax=Dothistroma septosporum (strain NZE10 / CBS 128990) TaxID=675120 RepID=N1PQY3_DOTSN|nr:hypothetical protein DOTSEDRAFT_72308 [Dothistroma septosporum NZE10]
MPISKTALTSDDFDGLDDADILQAEENSGLGVATGPIVSGVGDPSEDGIVIWRDPVSKQSYRVNSRTGVVLPAVLATGNLASGTTSHGTRRQPAAIDTALSSAGKPLSLARRAAAAAKDEALNVSTRNEKWLPGFLKEWNNPVFVARKEERIPVASIDGPSLLEGGSQVKCCARGAAGLHDSVQSSVHAASTKLSKAAFTQAEVLAQVDRKFILCKMAASAPDTDIIATSSLLVLIDQHAASERIILEGLFNSLFTTSHSTNGPTFTIKTINLPTGTSKQASLRYVITHQEHTLFTKYEPHFLLFGINYTSHPTQPLSHNNTGFHATRSAKLEYRLTVTDLPTVIAERCARLPTICIDLLRAELWALHDGTRSAVPRLPEFQVGEPAEPYWVKVLPLLPVKFLAMLQSRACRSAVMFNDPLSMQQCRDLVKDLGRCVFPFGCAHGRVSMVPLVDLGGHDADEVGEGGGIGRIERDLRWTGKPKEDQEGDQTDDGDVRERERTGDVGVLRAWMKSKKDV